MTKLNAVSLDLFFCLSGSVFLVALVVGCVIFELMCDERVRVWLLGKLRCKASEPRSA